MCKVVPTNSQTIWSLTQPIAHETCHSSHTQGSHSPITYPAHSPCTSLLPCCAPAARQSTWVCEGSSRAFTVREYVWTLHGGVHWLSAWQTTPGSFCITSIGTHVSRSDTTGETAAAHHHVLYRRLLNPCFSYLTSQSLTHSLTHSLSLSLSPSHSPE
jgi:hypothetical protein